MVLKSVGVREGVGDQGGDEGGGVEVVGEDAAAADISNMENGGGGVQFRRSLELGVEQPRFWMLEVALVMRMMGVPKTGW